MFWFNISLPDTIVIQPFREESLMICGGLGKSGKKKLNGYLPRKKTQLNNPEGKKTHQPVCQEKKLISRLARKKNWHEFSACAPPPLPIINGPSLREQTVSSAQWLSCIVMYLVSFAKKHFVGISEHHNFHNSILYGRSYIGTLLFGVSSRSVKDESLYLEIPY